MSSPTIITEAPSAALIGGGFIGPVHVEALRRIGVPVAGVLGSSPERASRTAQELGIGRIYRNLDDLLSDPKAAVVHVASPNQHHFAQVKSVIESGRHVICEKPLANSSQETRVLLELAGARREQATAVNYNVRYYPLCREIRERVARGDLGRLLSIAGSYVQDWLLYPEDYNWRVEPGGPANLRAVADIGTHWMDLAQYVTGKPIRAVCADVATFHPRRLRPRGSSETFTKASGSPAAATEEVDIKTDDYGAVLLRFDGGLHGLFHVSQMNAGRKNRLTIEIAGSKGSAAWDSESPNQLWLGSRKGPNQLLERDPALISAAAGSITHYPGGHAEGFPDTFKQLYLDVYRWIKSGRQAGSPAEFPNFADGDREVRLCEAIRRSALEGKWIEIRDGGATRAPAQTG
jgi:predicted dehydrogenase